jgi:hypothetical protein
MTRVNTYTPPFSPGGEPSSHPHRMSLTCVPGKNGRVFRVRCACMAQTRGEPSTRFFNYDWIKQGGADECVRAYHDHVIESET